MNYRYVSEVNVLLGSLSVNGNYYSLTDAVNHNEDTDDIIDLV